MSLHWFKSQLNLKKMGPGLEEHDLNVDAVTAFDTAFSTVYNFWHRRASKSTLARTVSLNLD